MISFQLSVEENNPVGGHSAVLPSAQQCWGVHRLDADSSRAKEADSFGYHVLLHFVQLHHPQRYQGALLAEEDAPQAPPQCGVSGPELPRDQDVLVVTAPKSGAEIIPFLKTYVQLPGAIAFTVLYSKMSNNMSQEKPCMTFFSTTIDTKVPS
eukprot:6454748-Amphidinium_carterae.1